VSLAQAGLESFEEYLSRVNLAGARLAYTLAAILVPLTWGLDWVSAPHLVWEFLAIRLGTSALALAGLALCHTRLLQRHPVALGAGAPVLCAMAIEAMILLHEGPASPYYAGLNLCILAVAVLYTWRWQRSLLVSGVIVALWLAPALPILLLGGLEYRAFFNNLVFLVDTAAIAVASAVIRYRSASREHQVRTELAGLSEELADALEKLQDNDRLKNEFFANVSHELRTPLTLILSPVEDLLTKKLDARVAESMRMVRRNAQRLLRLIDDLLDLARLDGQGLRLNVAQVGLSGLAERVADVARPAAEAKDVALLVECEGHVTVYGDPHRLEIILTNLVGNALKFTPRGGKIVVRVSSAADGVRLSVADTGPGIAEADIDRIFQRFYQVGGASGRSQGGGRYRITIGA
jgi:signal transduction histidine kinase